MYRYHVGEHRASRLVRKPGQSPQPSAVWTASGFWRVERECKNNDRQKWRRGLPRRHNPFRDNAPPRSIAAGIAITIGLGNIGRAITFVVEFGAAANRLAGVEALEFSG